MIFDQEDYQAKQYYPNPAVIDNDEWAGFMKSLVNNDIESLKKFITHHPENEFQAQYLAVYTKMRVNSLPYPTAKADDLSQQKLFQIQQLFLNLYDFEVQLDIILDIFYLWNNGKNLDRFSTFFMQLKFDKNDTEHQKLVYFHPVFKKIVSTLFDIEQFETLDCIEQALDIPLLDTRFSHTVINLKPPISESYTCILWQRSEPLDLVKPYFDIIYNYSAEKDAYLTQRGIAIPSQEDIDTLREGFRHFQSLYPTAFFTPRWVSIYRGLSQYEKVLTYHKLSEQAESMDNDADDKITLSRLKI